jgi:hypothetical protein
MCSFQNLSRSRTAGRQSFSWVKFEISENHRKLPGVYSTSFLYLTDQWFLELLYLTDQWFLELEPEEK